MDNKTHVVVTDVQMPFGSMVSFMVKWIIASIPAVLIILIMVALTATVLGGFFGVLLGLR